MIKIDLSEPDTPKWRAWVRRCTEMQERHNASIEEGGDSDVNEALYKEQKEDFYINKKGPFRGKCVYCESDIFKSQYGDVEHFRPKDAVADKDGRPIRIAYEGEARLHPGYYWLAYDWKNLIPACQLCNRTAPKRRTDGKLRGKGARFPVKNDDYAIRPGEEVNEEPLLINPVWTDPSTHLKIDETGVLSHEDDVGFMCIEIFGLNDRGLPDARKKVYDTVKKKYRLFVLSILMSACDRTSLNTELKEIEEGFEEHTMAARKAIEDAKTELRKDLGPALGY